MLADLLDLARRARSPNTGWAAMLDRAAAAPAELRELDLAGDALDLKGILAALRAVAPTPRAVRTLRFDLAARKLAVSGLKKDGTPVWLPDGREVALEGLASISRLCRARELARTLRAGAAALICRFATEGLRYRVTLGDDELRA